jgi:hypothetical protein
MAGWRTGRWRPFLSGHPLPPLRPAPSAMSLATADTAGSGRGFRALPSGLPPFVLPKRFSFGSARIAKICQAQGGSPRRAASTPSGTRYDYAVRRRRGRAGRSIHPSWMGKSCAWPHSSRTSCACPSRRPRTAPRTRVRDCRRMWRVAGVVPSRTGGRTSGSARSPAGGAGRAWCYRS